MKLKNSAVSQDLKNPEIKEVSKNNAWPANDKFHIIAFDPMPWDYPLGKIDKDISTVRSLMKSVADSGIDTVKTEGDIITQKTLLDAAKEFEINIIPINSDLCSPKPCLDLFKDLRTHQNLAAWQIMDEPHPYDWGGIFDDKGNILYSKDTVWNRLTIGHNLIKALDPSRPAMFNLAVDTDSSWIGKFSNTPGTTYDKYMSFLYHLNTLYNPKVWSFDYYPVGCKLKLNPKVENKKGLIPTDSQLDTVVWYNGLFTYLKCFQDITQATGSKFLAYTNCMHYNLYNSDGTFRIKYPMPSIGKLRLEVFSAMSFGASGIIYYRYGLGPNTIANQEDPIDWQKAFVCFESAVSYQNPKAIQKLPPYQDSGIVAELITPIVKSPTIWPLVKSMNEQIRLWQNLFIGCTVGKHRHAYVPNNPEGDPVVDVAVDKLSDGDLSNTCIQTLKCHFNKNATYIDKENASYDGKTGNYVTTTHNQPGILLNWFTNPSYKDDQYKNGHEHYIALLNLDIERPQQLTLRLNKGGYYFLKETKTGNVSTYSLSSTIPSPNTDNVITLSPGEMIVLFW